MNLKHLISIEIKRNNISKKKKTKHLHWRFNFKRKKTGLSLALNRLSELQCSNKTYNSIVKWVATFKSAAEMSHAKHKLYVIKILLMTYRYL